MTLTEFLLARISDDERMKLGGYPGRVMAECEAKRRILGAHPHLLGPDDELRGCAHCPRRVAPDGRYCPTLRALALPYAKHPDYRREWTP